MSNIPRLITAKRERGRKHEEDKEREMEST